MTNQLGSEAVLMYYGSKFALDWDLSIANLKTSEDLWTRLFNHESLSTFAAGNFQFPWLKAAEDLK